MKFQIINATLNICWSILCVAAIWIAFGWVGLSIATILLLATFLNGYQQGRAMAKELERILDRSKIEV